ncbi:unnamed protein product [Phytophthora lilii]|uniref:Unnamed protein product n=1 Tax=Phytophthora lilii TaxID=2077276 RepID=A0A9W6WIY2_9STRA|nr:unnamed protein product [Phytophthora lilii]
MLWKTATLAALCGLSAGSPALPDGPLRTLDRSPLYALRDSADSSVVWAEYERFVLSRSRVTPLLLYFGPAGCGEEEDEDEEVEGAMEASYPGTEACERHQKLVEAAVELAAETLSGPRLPVVRVDVHAWPEVLNYVSRYLR